MSQRKRKPGDTAALRQLVTETIGMVEQVKVAVAQHDDPWLDDNLGPERARLWVGAIIALGRLGLPLEAVSVCVRKLLDFWLNELLEDDADVQQLAALKKKLDRLERLPENEATRLQLESEIYRLENAADVDEWPEFIGEGGAR